MFTSPALSKALPIFDPGAGTANLTPVGSVDIFFAKYDNTGNYLWAKNIGSINIDGGNSIAVDTSGNVYITGYFQNTADFDPGAGTANLTLVGSVDIFFAKYDNNGNYLWAKNIGNTSTDEGRSIAVDASGNVYITGYFSGIVDFDPGAGTANLTMVGGYDIFFAKYFDCSGNPVNISLISDSTTCYGGADGSITAIVTGGFQPYTYLWNDVDSQTTAIATGLSAGSYTVIITDSMNCMDSAFSAVEQPTTYTLAVPICLVTVDSVFIKNVLVWEKPVTSGIDSFFIYREIGLNNYVKIGSVPYSALSEFTDTTNGINPKIQSYRYKISVMDTCGNESALSSHHRTIHLSTPQYTPPNTFDLIWTDYEGFSFSQYFILRDGNGTGNWQVIDSVTYVNLSYTEVNAPGPFAGYIVEAKPAQACNATLKLKKYYASKSNTAATQIPGGMGENINNDISIFPNPNKGIFELHITLLRCGLQNCELRITNVFGQEVKAVNKNTVAIDMSGEPSGVYFVEVKAGDIVGRAKVMVVMR